MRLLVIRACCGLGLAFAATFAGAEPGAPALTGGPAAAPAANYLGAMGIGVSDLQRSTRFYTDVLGLEVMRTYELGYIEEIVLDTLHSTAHIDHQRGVETHRQ